MTASELAASTQTHIDGMRSKADSAISNLLSASNSLVSGGASFTAITTPGGVYATTATVSEAVAQTLHAINAMAAWTTAPSLITAPALGGYSAPQWSESFWANLKAGIDKFTGSITDQTTLAGVGGVLDMLTSDTEKIQIAFYAEDLQRKQQVLRDLYSAANSQSGNKGFLFPQSMTTALKLDAQQKFQFDLSQTSRDLIKFIMEWAKSNWQFTMTQSINAHNADIDFNIRYCDVLLKSYATEVSAQLDKFKAQVAVDTARARDAVEAVQTTNDGILRKYATDVAMAGAKNSFAIDKDKIALSALTEHDKLAIEASIGQAVNSINAAQANIQLSLGAFNAKNQAAAQALQGAATIASSASQVALGILS